MISPNEPTSVVDVINDGLSKGILMLTSTPTRRTVTGHVHRHRQQDRGMVQGETLRDALGGAGWSG